MTTQLPDSSARREDANTRRALAADLSGDLPKLTPKNNGEETRFPTTQPANFTKGLKHDDHGFASPDDYDTFRTAVETGTVDMGGLSIAADSPKRKWESPLAGVYFNDIGADPDAIAMAPAPKLGRSELCAEMATVYAMALTRDIPFDALQDPNTKIIGITQPNGDTVKISDLVTELRKLSWFDPAGKPVGYYGSMLTMHEERRRASSWESQAAGLTADVLFRGSTAGAKSGPYISQFMLLGTHDLSGPDFTGGDPRNGQIRYGLQSTSQAQLVPDTGDDYMTTWEDWLTVQQGRDFDQPAHTETRRIHTPRDLAGYVHFDALYQAYLNACLIMLANNVPVDDGNPIGPRSENSTGFATWGGPHILSLVTEVATRGLRAARRTKFQVHRRARPEVIAARLAQVASGHTGPMDHAAKKQIKNMLEELEYDFGANAPTPGTLLDWVNQHNLARNGAGTAAPMTDESNFLLPMAFIEGSPMHPAYGAGHATVAGACVTILKAFFEVERAFSGSIAGGDVVYTADAADNLVAGAPQTATLSEELDKLAANISIGRNMAGVHYYSDYYDSLRMGERIAISVLREQMLTYHEPVRLSLRSFDGDRIVLCTNGGATAASVETRVYNASGAPVNFNGWWVRDVEEYGIVDSQAAVGV